MKKHLYFHCGNMQQTRALREDQMTKYPSDLEIEQKINLHRNEYAILETPDHYYHFLVGQMKQEGCPWCGKTGALIKSEKISSPSESWYVFYIQCSCGARGPTLNMRAKIVEDPQALEEIEDRVWYRYHHRRSWDDKLVNPYEVVNEKEEPTF